MKFILIKRLREKDSSEDCAWSLIISRFFTLPPLSLRQISEEVCAPIVSNPLL